MFLRSFAFYTIVICNKNCIRHIGCITFHVTEANVVKACCYMNMKERILETRNNLIAGLIYNNSMELLLIIPSKVLIKSKICLDTQGK